MAEMTDGEAIEDMRQGGTKGFDTLYWRYKDQVKGFLMSQKYYGLDEFLAEEICDDVFIRFDKKIGLFKEQCSVLTWLCRHLAPKEVATHWTKQNRLKRKQPEPKLSLLSEEDLSFEPEIETLCIEKCVRQALAQNQNGPLAECLKALRLRIEGFSIKEIVEKIGRSENAMTTFMSYCRKKQIVEKIGRSENAMTTFMSYCRKKLRKTPEFKRCWEDC
jgi:DNA-directed RNA polymerase specialized sigma24 family protein